MSNKVVPHSLFSDFDVELFAYGTHTRLHEKFGSHILEVDGLHGVYFSVYAPSAYKVEVIGGFNHWNGEEHCLNVRWDKSGIWEGFIPAVGKGELYKYRIYSNHDSVVREKADPYAKKYEVPPNTASIVWDDQYEWKDNGWMGERPDLNSLNAPMSVYEVHLGSWKKKNQNRESLSYTELAEELTSYISDMGYTHVEFLPVMEHPYYPSWGYLCTGYFAPTSRFGEPDEFKYLCDSLHQAKIGIILDWVPAHFPSDAHALADFDGSNLYEHPDRGKGFHPDWNSLIFNFERPQIRSFLLSSAHFWCSEYHVDGLRVDAVASMLYLDYSREEGEWSPNEFGGNEYLAASDFLRELNKSLYQDFPDINIIAEESTAFPGVTRPVDSNGLGFGLKWMMGWMNDTLEYFQRDTIYRKYHQGDISRSLTYAFSENYILPLSHDEVVHGKQSLIYKMPGDEWQKFANLRLLYTYMYTHPGQKLLFMGNDIGQTSEWNVNESIHWHLLDYEPHKGINNLIKSLNHIYQKEEPLTELNFTNEGFEWIDYGDAEKTMLSFIRKSKDSHLLIVLNFSPIVRDDYKVATFHHGKYELLLNSDSREYWGSDVGNFNTVECKKENHLGKEYTINITIPPLAGVILKPV